MTSLRFLLGAMIWLALAPARAEGNPEMDRIYQYFLPCGETNRPTLGAYLWLPPRTARIRAVMVAIHNGLPINILQSPAVRAVCRRQGIAQILLTPWAKDIGSVMLKDLNYDVTDPARTAVYDHYLAGLADLSGHPELVTAPIVPLAHSAFCDFPFNAALRRPKQCLGAIPIKAGLPDVYNHYTPGGPAKVPNTNLCLRYVPILLVQSGSQETVSWSPYPHALAGAGLGSYRRDHDNNPGTDYEPRDELFGNCWDMMSGHFDLLPRNYQFVADWLEAIAIARLPARAGDPLRNLTLRGGWLMNPQIPATGELPADYPPPAPYLAFAGHRSQALWFPNEALARRLFELGRSEPRKIIELFTFLDPNGQPISLAHGLMATMPDPQRLLHADGLFTLTTYRFTNPPDICLVKTKDHAQHPEQPHSYTNLLFPGRTTLPASRLPFHFDAHGGAFELVQSEEIMDDRGLAETRFTLRLKRHRIDPGAGLNMSFVRVYHEGDADFAAAGRTCQISLAPSDAASLQTATNQTLTFPPVPDAPATAAKIALSARSSAGLPVDYFVLQGPGIIQAGAFIPTEVPSAARRPMVVTIGAYQVGRFTAAGGVKPAETVFQTFHLLPADER